MEELTLGGLQNHWQITGEIVGWHCDTRQRDAVIESLGSEEKSIDESPKSMVYTALKVPVLVTPPNNFSIS